MHMHAYLCSDVLTSVPWLLRDNTKASASWVHMPDIWCSIMAKAANSSQKQAKYLTHQKSFEAIMSFWDITFLLCIAVFVGLLFSIIHFICFIQFYKILRAKLREKAQFTKKNPSLHKKLT